MDASNYSELPWVAPERPEPDDLHARRALVRSGKSSAALQMQQALAIAHSASNQAVFRGFNSLALEQASASDGALPLAGLAVSIKDLFDVQGEQTGSSAVVLNDAPPAVCDCPAVARLKAAGGVIIGRTHMSEFAFSGMGVNPHFGTPLNPAALALDGSQRIPGGSSSGAAVSVASGAAWLGLGSDTGGSIRIPAALCGLVGFKPTASTVPLAGTNALSYSMDSIGAITRSVRDAALAYEILSARPGAVNRELILLPQMRCDDSKARLNGLKLAVPNTLMLDELDAQSATNFHSSLERLRTAGASIERIEFPELGELSQLQARGGFSACELQSWLIPAGIWPQQAAQLDSRVRQRIATADQMSAADYVRLQRARAEWIARVEPTLKRFDLMLSPCTPIVAPLLADVAPGDAQDAAFFRANGLLLRNTLVVNFLDGCALSLPNQAPQSLPTGLMLWQRGHQDARVFALAALVEASLVDGQNE